MTKNKIIVFVIFIILLVVLLIRLFSGEDNWVCQNGQWIAHGHPDFSAPITICK